MPAQAGKHKIYPQYSTNKLVNFDEAILKKKNQSNPVYIWLYMGVSKNNGILKSSILIRFSIIFTIHFGGNTPIFGNIHIHTKKTGEMVES